MEHREYLAEIGRRGGVKRAQHPKRIEFAKRAARARWTAQKLLKPTQILPKTEKIKG